MIARVTIIEDDGNIKGVYELRPSHVYDCGISTKYKFDFEYCKLNDKYTVESEDI